MQKLINQLLEVIACIEIAISPLLIGLFFGGCLYYFIPNKVGMVLAIIIVLIGLVIGIFWAVKTTRKVGASTMMNRLTHQPEFDKDE
jgi:F0F1-type ATP synthase assembly protein I